MFAQHKICQTRGFLWPVFSGNKDIFIWENMGKRENPNSSIFYEVFKHKVIAAFWFCCCHLYSCHLLLVCYVFLFYQKEVFYLSYTRWKMFVFTGIFPYSDQKNSEFSLTVRTAFFLSFLNCSVAKAWKRVVTCKKYSLFQEKWHCNVFRDWTLKLRLRQHICRLTCISYTHFSKFFNNDLI